MCTVLLPPGVNPIAVNKYILSYIVCLYQYVSPGGYTCRFDMIFDRRYICACGWQIIKPVFCLKVNESSLLQQEPTTLPPVDPEAVSDPYLSLLLAVAWGEMGVVHRNSAVWRCSSRIQYAFFNGLCVAVLKL